MKARLRVFASVLILLGARHAYAFQTDLEIKARQAVSQKQFQAARDLYRQLSEREPQNADYVIWVGRISGWLEDFTVAENAFGTVLERDRRNTEAMIGLAYIHMYQRKYSQATELLDRARQITPVSVDLELAIARNYYYQGRNRLAQDHIAKAHSIDPSNTEVTDFRNEITPKRLEVVIGYAMDRYSFAPDSHAGSISIGYAGESTRLSITYERWEKFGERAHRFAPAVSQRLGQRVWLRIGAAVAPDATVIARRDYTAGFSVTLPKGFVIASDYRQLSFPDTRVHVASPSIEYYFEAPVWVQGVFYRSWTNYAPSNLTDTQSESYLLRYNHQIAGPILLRLSYARGIESFSALSIDRIGNFRANTYGAGADLKLNSTYSTGVFYTFQKRSNGSTQKGFGIALTIRP